MTNQQAAVLNKLDSMGYQARITRKESYGLLSVVTMRKLRMGYLHLIITTDGNYRDASTRWRPQSSRGTH